MRVAIVGAGIAVAGIFGLLIAETVTPSRAAAQSFVSGSCTTTSTLVLSQCTATVPATCTKPICSLNSATVLLAVSCSTSGTTLTASVTALTVATVNYFCPN